MARFNQAAVGTKTVNRAGGEAYKQSAPVNILGVLLTSFAKDQFYRSAGKTFEEVTELVCKDPLFAAKAAIFARNEFGMRSITHVTASEVVRYVKGEGWTKRFVDKVVRRPDDVLEILSYYIAKYGKPIPNALKKGLALALGRFDAYQIGKYKGAGKAIKMVDAINLVHPKHTAPLGALINGALQAPDTWEVRLTQAGGNVDKRARVWMDLLSAKRLGYFALLRNLRNIIEQAPDMIDEACKQLTDERAIAGALVLPFRFLTAMDVLSEMAAPRQVVMAVSTALDLSVRNVPVFRGRTLVALDDSGSMTYNNTAQKAAMFAMALYKSNDCDLMMFSGDARYVSPNPLDSIIGMCNQLPFSGGSTNFDAIFERAKKAYDRIVILSDMQGWVGYDSPAIPFKEYKLRTGADPRVYSWDLAGYGDMQFPERNVTCLAGFSDKVFDLMKLCEEDSKAVEKRIRDIEI